MPIVSIVLFIVAAALLIYAGIAALTKSIPVQPTRRASVQNVTQAYAVQFAKLIALMAAAPAIGGIVGLFVEEKPLIAVIVFIVLFIGLMILGIKTIMKEK